MHGQCHASAALPPEEKPFAHSTGSWRIPFASLDGCREEKIPSSSGVQTHNRQPVMFRSTD